MINKIKLLTTAIIMAVVLSNISYADSELDNIEILTISTDSNFYFEDNIDISKAKRKKLGEIELNKVLSKEEYIKDLNNFRSYYIDEQGYFGGYTKEKINDDIDRLLQNPENHTVSDLNIELGKIISKMNDGHTTSMYSIGKERFPFMIQIIGNDFYIINTTEKCKDLLYAKIVSIEGVKPSEIIKIASKYISGENKTFKNYVLKNGYILYTDLLKKENIIKGDKVHLQILQNDKIVKKIIDVLEVDNIGIYRNYYNDKNYSEIFCDNNEVNWDMYTNWDKMEFTDNKPFYFYKSNKNLVIKYNSSYDTDKYNVLQDMITKMQNEVKAKDIDNIILDIRYNGGGSEPHIRKMELAIKQYQLLNPKINIKVLTGEGVFSAATMITDSIKRNLENAEIIGTNTGGASTYNTYSRNILYLGKSKLFIYVSDKMRRYDYTYKDVLHCSNLNKGDGSTWVPDMFIENQIQDYAIGNDKIMNYALIDEVN